MAFAILEDKGGHEHTNEKEGMHFNICKTCLPYYADDEEEKDVAPAEDENGNVWVQKAIGVQIIKEYEPCELPVCKQRQQLKYPHPDICKFNALHFNLT